MESDKRKLPPPPGLITALTAGFDSVANNIIVISLPVLLDLFLWLGPHLGLQKFLQPLIDSFTLLPSTIATQGLPDAATVQQFWGELSQNFNLFVLLRTLPVGVSSLMSGRWPIETPLGKPIQAEAGSLPIVAGWLIVIILTGWILGGLYYHWVSAITLKQQNKRPLFSSIAQTILLSVILITLVVMIGIPVLMLVGILTLFSSFLGQIAIFIIALFSVWIILPLFFSTHGIFAFQQNAISSVLNSLRMVRFTLPTSGLFLIMLVVIGQGLDFLWRTPQETSWLTLVGIAGHAFISTALLAASFVYYRDVNAWLQSAFELLNTRTKKTQA